MNQKDGESDLLVNIPTDKKKSYGRTHSIHIPRWKDKDIFGDNVEMNMLFWDMVQIIKVSSMPLKHHSALIRLKQIVKKKPIKQLEEI